MSFSSLRIGLFITFIALLAWKAIGGSLDDYWIYLGAYVVLMQATRVAERLRWRWTVRQGVHRLRRLDPEHRERVVGSMWPSLVRQLYVERLRKEGGPERDGTIERFPFAHSDRRENTMLFWSATATAAAVLVIPVFVHDLSTAVGWAFLLLALVLVTIVARLRRRGRHLTTVLEVSPFGVSEISENDARRTIRWSEMLVLHNYPRRKRLELSRAGMMDFIALDYDRLGFERALGLVLEYGGFTRDASARGRLGPEPASSEDD
jgi:hypothetical protein